ncbi:MAG: FtsX-like permease family protein [Ignavibacteriales bacterium]|nr:ABC transporter permease [Ignavibacteriaceae bacterium]NLH62360.1 FtsX-like permease family protein [Ignavibacteriales bacterium]HOJ18723.1 ABC transporter permease [Ignavibacteriaceae bacterium]HPO56903.1 ABC transporter permease [Ignavibacteriaceae bacterium]
MNYKESFKIGLNGLRANIMRTGLTMLGIIFGVAAVISMLSIGEGAKQETLQQIELLGTNNIIINKKAVENTGTSSKASYSLGLTTKDLEAIKAIAPDIQIITPVRESKHGVMYKSNLSQNVITGTSTGYPMTFNSKLVEGTFFKEYHQELRANVCVIGSGVKERLFKYESPLNKKIKIGEMWFSIIGVVAPKSVSSAGSQSFGIRNFNEDIYIPLNTMLYKFTKVEVDPNFVVRGNVTITNEDDIIRQSDRVSLDQIIVKVDKSERLKEIAALTGRILDRRHFGVKDYEIVLPEQLLEQKQKTQRIFNIVMGAIAGISLLVGGIGIMNIMLANILERTREIGVRRAVGATMNDILLQFLSEAVTISVLGGVLGILVGFILTAAISTYAEWNTIVSPISVILAFTVSVATGIVFGIYPAKKAADKNPIESLRYE